MSFMKHHGRRFPPLSCHFMTIHDASLLRYPTMRNTLNVTRNRIGRSKKLSAVGHDEPADGMPESPGKSRTNAVFHRCVCPNFTSSVQETHRLCQFPSAEEKCLVGDEPRQHSFKKHDEPLDYSQRWSLAQRFTCWTRIWCQFGDTSVHTADITPGPPRNSFLFTLGLEVSLASFLD